MTGERRLLLLALGGTIGCRPSSAGLVPTLGAAELLAAVGVPDGLRVDAEDLLVRTVVFPDDWVALGAAIEARRGYDGFVLTLGTDTLAWVAAALALLAPARTVVLTGAMRPCGFPGSDAPRNLTDALRVAASGRPGVFVVFGGRIIAGARASKVESEAPRAFASINAPAVGRVRGGAVVWRARAEARPATPPGLPRFEPNVAVLTLGPQTRPADVARFASCRGVLVEGFGDGNVASHLVPALTTLARRRVVVLASQCARGVVRHRYEGGQALVRSGAVSAGSLTKEMALVRLMWALGQTRRADVARALFAAPIEGTLG